MNNSQSPAVAGGTFFLVILIVGAVLIMLVVLGLHACGGTNASSGDGRVLCPSAEVQIYRVLANGDYEVLLRGPAPADPEVWVHINHGRWVNQGCVFVSNE